MKKILSLLAAIALSGVMSLTANAQGFAVQGVVVDQMGPVIGAAVLEAGTTNGAVTDLDGTFSIRVSSPDATVEVSCIGYTSLSFKASEMPSTITLHEDNEFLDEVVVIGYGTVKKSDMTGSVVAIKNDEMNRGAITSPSQALMGKVSGLHIVPASGQPGDGAMIRIRGAASLTASNDPLIVIDGVPVTGDGGAGMGDPLASVNPNDIESFSVLKDASATAIYGSRASNGVIIITTKKGNGGRIRVTYNGSVSAKQNIATLDMMNGYQFRGAVKAYHPEYSSLLGDGSTNWQDQIYRIGVSTDHNLSVYGGNKLPFRVSVGYNLDQATIKLGDNNRVNADLSLSPKFLDDHLSVNVNLKGIYQKTVWANSGAVGAAVAYDPTHPIYRADGTPWNWYNADGTPNTMASTNPLSVLYDYYNQGQTLRSIGNMQVDYKVHGLEDLRFNLNLGYDIAGTVGNQYNEIGSYSSLRATPDYAVIYKNYNRNLLLEAYADYNHEFDWCTLDAMAGYSWQRNYVRYDNTQYYNKEPRWQDADIYEVKPFDAREYVLISFFGRVNWAIRSKYLFTFTVREDASSRFSPKNRWGFFPSAAFAWNIANEDFLKGVRNVSALKLRLGWGRTGQQDIGGDYYPYVARYYQATDQRMRYNMGNDNSNVLGPVAYNPDIKWETTETWNAGLDFGFFGDRLTGTVEAYYRRTFDLLNSINFPMGTNFTNMLIDNIGEMVNKGVEITLNTVPVETKDWHWSIGGNVTFQDTRITKLTAKNIAGYLGVTTGPNLGGTDGYTSLHRVGFAPYTFYLYEQAYDTLGRPIENVLIDRNGDGTISESDRYVTGYNPNPWMFFGVNTHLSYKNWDFSINGHGSVGSYALNRVAMGYSAAISEDASKNFIQNWSNTYLIPGWSDLPQTVQKYSDMFVENTSFFKIDDINLGYTFHLKRFAESIRVAASIQNVATFTKYRGLDPELQGVDGVDNNMFPRPRLYTIRLNINF